MDLLFLAETVARRRALPKVTDSDTFFVAMQYFAMDGNFDELCSPFDHEEDQRGTPLSWPVAWGTQLSGDEGRT